MLDIDARAMGKMGFVFICGIDRSSGLVAVV